MPRSSPVPDDDIKMRTLAPSLILNSPDVTPTPIVVQAPAAATAIKSPDEAAAATRRGRGVGGIGVRGGVAAGAVTSALNSAR